MENNVIEDNKSISSESSSISDDENSSMDLKDEHSSLSSKHIPNLNKTLERIHENDEDTYSTNKDTKDLIDAIQQEQEPKELIFSLRQKIEILEEQICNLRKKNDELKKDNIQNNTTIKRMSFVGNRKNFSLGLNDNTCKIKMAEILKEKNDLQEMNENMLNMLTEKEIENEELQENLTIYKNEMKNEVQKYIETIDKLEEKIMILEENNQNREKFDNNLDEIINEYNRYKERMEKSLNEHLDKEKELMNEVENKEILVQNMKNEIQNLEIENIQLIKQNEQKIKDYDTEMIDINSLTIENEKLKNEISNWQRKMQSLEIRTQSNISAKEEEIKLIKEDLELNSKNMSKIKEEKNNEINSLKAEINKYNRDMNNLIKKFDSLQKENNEIKNNFSILQKKLDKKTKDLLNINESTKKIIENKENIIKEYEDKIEEIKKDRSQLIDQNHDLLDKVRDMNSSTLGELLGDADEDDNNDNNENLLLKSEIKNLKEQLEKQVNDLISLNAMEKEVSRLKIENDKLIKDNKDLKDNINKLKYNSENDDLMKLIKKNYNNYNCSDQKAKRKRISVINISENNKLNNKFNFEKEVGIFKKMQEEETKKMSNEINKLKEDIALIKIKYYNKDLENETLIVKYRNILKSIGNECKKFGIKLNLNLNLNRI